MLTDVQRQKITHLFKVMDGDGNGVMEWADFERIANNIAGQRSYLPGTAEYTALMGQYQMAWQMTAPFTTDGGMNIDQYLAYTDAFVSTPGHYDPLVRASAAIIFDTFDKDGDGKVTLGEWRDFFRAYGIDPGQADQHFGRYDGNGDGHVERNELIDLVHQFYMSADPTAPGNWLYGAWS